VWPRRTRALEQTLPNYKRRAEFERAFRTLKGIDIQVHPIRPAGETRVKAHIFVSMLAYYVQCHMIEASAARPLKDEVAADAARLAIPLPGLAVRPRTRQGEETRTLAYGTPALSFTRLLCATRFAPRARAWRGHLHLHPHHPAPKQQHSLDPVAGITV
jgi:hypothetical protein